MEYTAQLATLSPPGAGRMDPSPRPGWWSHPLGIEDLMDPTEADEDGED